MRQRAGGRGPGDTEERLAVVPCPRVLVCFVSRALFSCPKSLSSYLCFRCLLALSCRLIARLLVLVLLTGSLPAADCWEVVQSSGILSLLGQAVQIRRHGWGVQHWAQALRRSDGGRTGIAG